MLLSELVRPSLPTVPKPPFEARLDGGRTVTVTAVLERTAVYWADSPNDKRTALLARFEVHGDVPLTEKGREHRVWAARVRAHQESRSPSAKRRPTVEELREEALGLRAQLERLAPLAELGRELVRVCASEAWDAERWLALRERAAEMTEAAEGAA